jgi:hypothetical protein
MSKKVLVLFLLNAFIFLSAALVQLHMRPLTALISGMLPQFFFLPGLVARAAAAQPILIKMEVFEMQVYGKRYKGFHYFFSKLKSED